MRDINGYINETKDRDIMEFTADNLMDMTKDALKQLIQDKGVDRL